MCVSNCIVPVGFPSWFCLFFFSIWPDDGYVRAASVLGIFCWLSGIDTVQWDLIVPVKQDNAYLPFLTILQIAVLSSAGWYRCVHDNLEIRFTHPGSFLSS